MGKPDGAETAGLGAAPAGGCGEQDPFPGGPCQACGRKGPSPFRPAAVLRHGELHLRPAVADPWRYSSPRLYLEACEKCREDHFSLPGENKIDRRVFFKVGGTDGNPGAARRNRDIR